MAIVKFGDIVRDVKINVDRANNPYEHYVAGDHMDSEDLTIHRYGSFETDDVGPAFTRIFKPGQILYGSRRTYLKKVAVADFEGICANTTFVLESKDEALFDNRLLPFIMLSDAFTRWSIAHSKGSTNPYVLFSDLADYEFDLPPLAEQKVLADKLWAAYRLKESYKKLLTATEEMVKSQFIEMFGDPLKNPKNYTQRKLGDVATLLNGRAYKASELLSSGRYLVLRVGNFFTNTDYYYSDLELEPDKYCDTGDILYSWSATLGAQIWKGGKVIYHYHIWKVLFDENILNKEYFCFMLNVMTDSLKQETHGSTMVHLTKDGMEKKFIAIPPLELQRRFVSIAEQADKSGFDELKSQFIEMFGDNVSKKKISDVCDVRGGSTPTRTTKEFWNNGTISWFTIEDIYEQGRYISETKQHITELATKKCFVYPVDTVLICCTASVGEYAITKKEMASNQQFNGMMIKDKSELHPEYLLYVASTLKEDLLRQAGKTTINFVSRSKLENIEIPVPPYSEQLGFVSVYRQADKSGSVLQYMIAC